MAKEEKKPAEIEGLSEMNILQLLHEARKIIKTSGEKKAGHNSYSGYDYYTPEQVDNLVFQACEQTRTECLTNLKKDALGCYQTLDFVNLDKPAESLHFELRTESPEIKATNAAQQMGGMDTYSERYIKMKVFQIKDNNLDFDSQDNRNPAPATKPAWQAKPFTPKKPQYQKAESHDRSIDSAENDMGSIDYGDAPMPDLPF
jgi:hypothetical protein